MLTLAQAFENWETDTMPAVIAQYSADDYPALSESWNDYTDGLCKDGELSNLQYHYCPAWDEEMPDSDQAYILEQMGLKFSAVRVLERPDGITDWAPGSSHWRVLLQRSGAEFQTHYSMGPAHAGEPEMADVLACLLSDASGANDADSFEEWASNYGYDTDSRRAERMYKSCQETAARLALLFTASELSDLEELFSDY